MKPFDLDKAKQGHPICTRDGRSAILVAVLNSCFFFRVHVDVIDWDFTRRRIRYTTQGKEFGEGDSHNDLFLADEKETANP